MPPHSYDEMKTYYCVTNFFCKQVYKTYLITSHAGGAISCNGHYSGNVNLARTKFIQPYIFRPGIVRSGSVRRETICSHNSSPIQNQENIASLADDVISTNTPREFHVKFTWNLRVNGNPREIHVKSNLHH